MASKKEIVGNYEVINDREVITRREVLLMGAMAAGGLVTASPAFAAAPKVIAEAGGAAKATGDTPYVARDFSSLVSKKMPGLSESQISQHIKLYQGYIAKANELNTKLKDPDLAGPNATYAPLREMLVEESYAVNGVVYHEYYFGNLGGKGGEPTGDLKNALEERWAAPENSWII